MVIGLQNNPIENQRQQNLNNERLKKFQEETKRGVIVNSIVKDSINYNQNDMLRDYIIPADMEIPEDIKQPKKETSNQPLLKLCLGSLGVLGAIGAITKASNKIAEKQFKKPKWDSLPDIGRNMNLNSESHFVTYMMIQNPQTKTVIGASAFFVFAATAFVLKNFTDGFKDIWVKKQYAKADYKLQDNLIDVETRIFKGKNEIIRTMMQDTAKEMKIIIENKNVQKSQSFEGFTPFKGNIEPEKNETQKPEEPKKDNFIPAMLTIGTIIGAVLLGKYAFKNIQKTGKIIQDSNDNMHKQIGEILNKTPDEILEQNKDTLKDIFSVMNFKPYEVEDKLKKAKLPEAEIKEIVEAVQERTKKFTQAPAALGGHPGKVQYFTYIDDAKGHFYNWIMNIESKPLGVLAMAIAAVTGVGYVGEQSVNGMREAEVKKMNNETELNLHKRLINVELRNFKQKKESYIKPLLKEFKAQAPQKSKAQLDSMAQNILYEIKNGPPFVYA
ncbi:MAG: hypothetical protein WCF95_02935 [bacterium]